VVICRNELLTICRGCNRGTTAAITTGTAAVVATQTRPSPLLRGYLPQRADGYCHSCNRGTTAAIATGTAAVVATQTRPSPLLRGYFSQRAAGYPPRLQ
jgi:hypothetical protein